MYSRASKLLNELKVEEFQQLKGGRDFSHVRAGDSVEIHKLPYITATTPDIIKGVVIGISNRHGETGIKLANVNASSLFIHCVHKFTTMFSAITISLNMAFPFTDI